MICKQCGSDRMRPSRPGGFLEEQLRSLTGTRYYRCSACGHRERYARTGRDGEKKEGVDLRFWIAVAALGVGFLVLLRFVG